jgi:hypothetical protein
VVDAVQKEKAPSDDPSDEQCDVGEVHDPSLQFKAPLQLDGVLRDILGTDKLQVVWFVDIRHSETRTGVPVNLQGRNAIGINIVSFRRQFPDA